MLEMNALISFVLLLERICDDRAPELYQNTLWLLDISSLASLLRVQLAEPSVKRT